jgi:hypothetical protein
MCGLSVFSRALPGRRWRMAVTASLLAGPLLGCLQEGRGVDARLLHPGRDIEAPVFVQADGRLAVTFVVRHRPPTADPAEFRSYNLWRVPFERSAGDGNPLNDGAGSEARPILENIAERDGWHPQGDGAGLVYYMVDARRLDGGPPGSPTAAGTLARLDLGSGVLDRIPDVSSFSVSRRRGTTELTYRRPVEGSRLTELRFRSYGRSEVLDRPLGPSSGSIQFVGPGHLYFVTGDDRTLARITSADSPVEPLRRQVSNFVATETWVALQVTEEGKRTPTHLLFDPRDGNERRLPGDNICCWVGFSGGQFVYSEAASGDLPGRLHLYDVESGDDEVVALPASLANVARIIRRPRSGSDMLLVDDRGRGAMFRVGDGGWVRPIDGVTGAISFTEDGRFLLFIDQVDPPEGRLMIQDAELERPPRRLSPPDSLASPGYFFVSDGARRILVFSARYGRGSSDLYYANHETGESRVVAEGILDVIARPWHLIGIVRLSQQDLVGDLVHRDLTRDDEVVLAHRVSDVALLESDRELRAAFVLRDRTATGRDGLWAIGP